MLKFRKILYCRFAEIVLIVNDQCTLIKTVILVHFKMNFIIYRSFSYAEEQSDLLMVNGFTENHTMYNSIPDSTKFIIIFLLS